MDQDGTTTRQKSTCGHYVVGLIDVLGQRKQLGGWNSLPETSAGQATFKRALKNTAGVVADFRKDFRRFVHKYASHDGSLPEHTRLTKDQKAEYYRLRDVELGCQQFSDTVILYSPLAVHRGGPPINAVYGMLVGTAYMLLTWLARGVPLRGGINIGMAIDYFPKEIYGPVLPCVNHLEKKVAQYPRVVVGAEVTKYLEACVAKPNRGIADQLNRVMATECQSLIDRDQNGALFVNFLGDGLRLIYPDKADYREQVKKGHAFAKREHERFVAGGDQKLAPRYARLRQYYESNMRRSTT